MKASMSLGKRLKVPPTVVPPPSQPKILLKHLAHLAAKCGLPVSGTKETQMAQFRRAVAATPKGLPPSTRVCSIDLGIRNLAYACVTFPQTKPPRKKPSTSEPPPPSFSLIDWQRLDLLAPKSDPTEEEPPAEEEEEAENPPRKTKAKPNPKKTPAPEDFTPPAISRLALNLLTTYILPLNPTHILLERQRFRTGGASAVLEWTLRVNTLETAIHAALATLQHLGIWTGEVVCVPPNRAARFMMGDGMQAGGEAAKLLLRGPPRPEGVVVGSKVSAKLVKRALKMAKIRVLEESLMEGQVLELGTEAARRTAAAFVAAAERRKAGKKGVRRKKGDAEAVGMKEDEKEIGKRDDLADSLFQAVAWLEWQKNLDKLRTEEPWVLEKG